MRVKREVLTLKFDAKTLNIIVTKAVTEPTQFWCRDQDLDT